MFVCVCNNLTETAVRAAIAESRAGTPEDVLRHLRGSPQCGVCRSMIAEMLNEDPDADDVPYGGFGPA